jgi:alpha-tubulin suppressor-like RCC1 family protein
MPKDDINYKFTENGIVYDFYDVFVPAENFRQPSLFTWGIDDDARLGTNGGGNRSTPVTTFAGGTTWKSVACGVEHTAAIKTDGSLWTWGRGNDGRLGNFSTTARSTPVTTFAGGNNWKSVICGSYHTAAIKTDGSLWVWGANSVQLGINATGSRSTPVTTFAGGNDWKQVSGGQEHTAAVKTDGSLWVWGVGTNGRLGNFDTTQRNTPVTTFAGGNNWKQVSCGDFHTAAVKTDGTLWTWGSNNTFGFSTGQLGVNDLVDRSTPVTTFAGGTNWKSVSCGSYHTAAIKTDGSLWVWGRNNVGQSGGGSAGITPITTFAGGTNWKSVTSGLDHITAIKTDGTLWVWGRNNNAQLGTNDTTQRNTPVTTFAGGNNWKSTGGGYKHTAAIKYSPDP